MMRNLLLDISSIAACFEGYGHHPLMYIVNRLGARINTYHTLLGNFAGSALDDIIHHPDDYNINDTIRNNFKEKALEYVTCEDFDGKRFKQDAERQAKNMREIVGSLKNDSHSTPLYLLEPSFVCPTLGLQGRVDLMTNDMRLLVEQKSGKNICPQKHYIQALLYYAVLAENFGVGEEDVDIELLYSKFALPDGLRHIDAQRNKKLLQQALDFRDEVEALLYRIADEGFESIIDQLTPETLAGECYTEQFFQRWELPRLQALLQPLHELSPLERAYFCRMMTFVVKERVTPAAPTGDLSPLHESDMYKGLTIRDLRQSTTYNGYDTVVLDVPEQDEDFMPDFRRGDMVYLYAYPECEEPDSSHAILYKGVLADVMPDTVTVHLSDGQQDPQVLYKRRIYAIEHTGSDMMGSSIHSLYALISSSQERRDLLLGQREPRRSPERTLTRSYHPDYDDMLLRCKQADDYFLLVGPPGTGKTSMAMRFMVEEFHSSLLLLSYTNRAVDEICGMLVDAGKDFIRLGNEFSCDPRFRGNLLSSLHTPHSTLHELRQRLIDAPIIVSTTSTLASRSYLLNIKHFSTIIVDEASQILEPNIIGLLAKEECRFVLIGDYKQLPAVVQQSVEDSCVKDETLKKIHMDNCRNSLFERLIRTEQAAQRSDFIGILRKYGRMHPAVAEFPCKEFYAEEQLSAVPLPHQTDEDDHRLFMGRRVMFFPSAYCLQPGLSDKVNIEEARIVARLLIDIRNHYGEQFDPLKTVGVIVPYRNQIASIRRSLAEAGATGLDDVSIDTVERYQGSQRDIIIYSFTAQMPYQLEFLTSNCFVENGRVIDRKLNVVMTRARKQLFMTGNRQLLMQNGVFRRLIESVPTVSLN